MMPPRPILALLFLATSLRAAALPVPVPEPALHSAAQYLLQSCDATGQFRYRVNMDPSVRLPPRYNMLRHAGTIYALALYEKRYPSAFTRAAMTRAVGYLLRNAVGGVGSDTNLLAVWSRPEINHADSETQAKLGGTGLGLVALVSARRAGIARPDLDTLRKLGRFILFMQEDNGRFVAKYVPDRGGRVDSWISLYYPGEAALGLLMLYELDPDEAWLNAATRALVFLAESRQGRDNLPPDHWVLLATHRLLRLPRSWEQTRQDDLLRAHAADLCRDILATRASGARYVGFTGDGRTCPTATRLEGLIAAMPLLSDPLVAARTQNAVDRGIDFLLRTQVREGRWAGAWPRAAEPLSREHFAYSPDFNRRATEIRIDYVQHALSALLMYTAVKADN